MKAFVLNFLLLLLGAGALVAQTINATQADDLIIDNSVTGKADPGDKIRYTIIVSETGGTTNATGVQVTVSPDDLTTLVAGSFKTSPVAVNDGTYDCIGNVGINVPAGSGVKLNDFDDDLANATLSCGTCLSANGGTVTMHATDGSFTYLPAPGFTGMDNFTYTLTDVTQAGPGAPTTNTATVTINVSGMIWFVDENQGSNGDGRLGMAFNTLPNYVSGAADDPSDNIFLYSSADPYTGGITLLMNQKLIGQGATVSLATATGLTVPTHSNALPSTSGTRPVVVNASGDGVTLATGNTIRGLNLGNCLDFAIEDNGTVGTLTISEVDINTTGGAFQTDAGGTLAVTLGSVTSTGGSRGIYLNTTGGSFTVTGATSCTNPLNQGIRITSVSTNVSFAAITIGNTGSGAEAMELNGNTGTFMATGLTTINAPAVGGNISLHISGGSGAITFANIDINGRRDKGIRIAGGNRNIITGTVDIDNANSVVAIVLEINAPTGGTIGFGATTINVGGVGSNGIDIQSSAAIVSFASGSAVSNSTVAEFNVNLGAGNITYDGTVSSTSGGAVSITSRTGGTVNMTGNITSTGAAIGIAVGSNSGGSIFNFSGASKTITSSTANGVSLTSNTGAIINFTNGGLVINTTTGTGFNATGGGTVTVQGTGNTINSTSGATALNVVSTTIGASGLTFQSIASTGGTAPGINLNTTGSGGLTVTGDGGGSNNGSGGSITNKTGSSEATGTPGVRLFNVSNVRLKYMNITGCNHSGIYGGLVSNPAGVIDASTINGFQLERCNITGNGDTGTSLPDETGVDLYNLVGTAIGSTNPTSIVNCTISGNLEFELQITNRTTTALTDLQMSGNTLLNTTSASGHGNLFNFLGEGGGAANMKLTLTSGTFTGNAPFTATAIQCDHSGTGGTMTANVSGATFTNNNVGPQASVAGGAQVIFNFSNNTVTGTRSTGINVFADANSPFTKSITGRIENNIVGTQGVLNSGSSLGPGIRVQNEGSIPITMRISGNTIQECENFQGININVGISIAGGGALNSYTIINNTIRDIHNSRAIAVQDNATTAPFPTICANISGNIMSNIAGQAGDGTFVRVRRLNGTFNVTQASLAALEAANTCNAGSCSGLFAPSGTITYNQPPCALPSN